MADIAEFLPLFRETIDSIRARMDADVNAGVDPIDAAFKDTTPGGFYWDITQTACLEIERLWDFLSVEVPASMFPAYAWGDYLDEHGFTLGLSRKAAVRATGEVTFFGDAGTLIATGTEVATEQTDPDEDPITFRTTEAIVLPASPGPTALSTTPAGTGGTLAADDYFYVVTAIIPDGETVISNEDSATTTGSTSKVTLDWTAAAGATAYKIYRGSETGKLFLLATLGNVVTYDDTGAATTTGDVPPTNKAQVEAVEAGTIGNVAAGTITFLMSPVSGVESIDNEDATTGGFNVESDELFRQRILVEYRASKGAGTASDYERWALAYASVGFATIEPLWNGAGTVRVIITDQFNNPVSATVIAGLQAELDPVAGMGHGLAPVGAIVTVATPSLFTQAVGATITLESGYSFDGSAGTVAVRSDIEDAIKDYIDKLSPGEDIVRQEIAAAVLSVVGVYDVNVTTPATNIAVGALQVARTGTVTLA